MAYIGREPLGGEVILMNSIESQFNGVLTTFNLTRTVNGVTSAFYPIITEQLLVSLGGVIQKPDTTGNIGFRISFNTIIFAVAPVASTSCFIVAYGNITDIGSPANNTVTTEKLVNGAVTPVKLSTGGPWWLSNGNVGIGTTNPGYTLDVQGSQNVTTQISLWGRTIGQPQTLIEPGRIYATSAGLGPGNLLLQPTGGNLGIGTESPSENLHIHAPGNDLAAIILSGTAVGQVPYQVRQGINGVSNSGFSIYDITAAATRFAIDSAGNIGIGTGTPSKKLDVKIPDTSSGTRYVAHFGGSNHLTGYAIGIGLDPEGYGYRNKIGILAEGISAGWSRGKLHFALNGISDANEASIADAKMTILESGNVGIGTTNPSRTLHIYSSSPIRFSDQNRIWDINLKAGKLVIGDDTGSADRFTIDTSGNVGIATTSPTHKLDVNGSIRAISYGSLGDYSALLGQIRVGGDQYGNTIKVVNDTNLNIIANNNIYFNTGAATDGSNTGSYVGYFGPNGLYMAPGKGIDFSANSNVAGMTSELLDDYEEGTWTPVLTCRSSPSGALTYAQNSGKYIKIGDLVFVSAFVTWNGGSISGSTVQLTGLPFIAGSNPQRGGFHITYSSSGWITGATIYQQTFRSEAGEINAIYNFSDATDGKIDSAITGSQVSSTGEVMITGTYTI